MTCTWGLSLPPLYSWYRPFHKTLQRFNVFVNRIKVRFYETGCMYINVPQQWYMIHFSNWSDMTATSETLEHIKKFPGPLSVFLNQKGLPTHIFVFSCVTEQSQNFHCYFPIFLGKTHIKKVVFLVVGPLRSAPLEP